MKIRTLILAALVFTSCSQKTEKADAYGNFEATETIVSAETAGRILQFTPAEGSLLTKGSQIALIDTTILCLQRNEIEAGMKSVATRLASVNAQDAVLNQQIENIRINLNRVEKMMKDDAATQKQYDDLNGQVAVLQKQIAANNTQRSSIAAELSVYVSKKATVLEQLKRCSVLSPSDGTILEKYSEEGEMTAPGKPLVKIADLKTMRLKAYVSGAEIGKIKISQSCTVRIDNGTKGFTSYPGVISYISDKAEFTPKIIQTKDERVALVYAVKIDVQNDGSVKSGMPGEALFSLK